MSLRRVVAIAAAVASLSSISACGQHRPPRLRGSDAPLTISQEQQSAWVRNFNPLLPPGRARWPTRDGVYEPLYIYNPFAKGGGAWTPWLGTSYSWSPDLLHLRFTVRSDVKWSDGEPFSAEDVAYTFQLLQRAPALDQQHVWGFLAKVEALDPVTVEFTFSRPYVPGMEDLAPQPIVAKHIFEKIADPLTFTNPSPVGTGPFTEVRVFRDQVYEIGKNPHYWQPGKPKVAAIRFLAYPTNDQANVALAMGDIDWSANFVPAVERTFVARDPKHRTSWSPLVGAMALLFVNHERGALGDVRVRKALSMAIDRERVVSVAMYGMTRPADATGLTDFYQGWRDDAAGDQPWMKHDVAAAEKLLDEAGCKRGEGGVRRCADGKPLDFDIEVVSGWSDWVRAAQLIARDLAAVGVTAHLRTYEFGAWMSRLQQGTFSLSVGYSMDGPTPYRFYRFMMSSKLVKPLGELTTLNWHRFGDAQADALLEEFEKAGSTEAQHAISVKLQQRFAETAPVVPLFANPLWGEYSTERFVGFPGPENPYARLSPNAEPDPLFTLVNVEPRPN
jgi:peptide/nickel transport system substrate-binding protein